MIKMSETINITNITLPNNLCNKDCKDKFIMVNLMIIMIKINLTWVFLMLNLIIRVATDDNCKHQEDLSRIE